MEGKHTAKPDTIRYLAKCKKFTKVPRSKADPIEHGCLKEGRLELAFPAIAYKSSSAQP